MTKCALRHYSCGDSGDIYEYPCGKKTCARGLCSQHYQWNHYKDFKKLHPTNKEIKPFKNINEYIVALGYKKDEEYYIWRKI